MSELNITQFLDTFIQLTVTTDERIITINLEPLASKVKVSLYSTGSTVTYGFVSYLIWNQIQHLPVQYMYNEVHKAFLGHVTQDCKNFTSNKSQVPYDQYQIILSFRRKLPVINLSI